MKLKFVVHSSDFYYPSAEEFDTYANADKAFSKLREKRMNRIKEGCYLNSEIDYLCVVISEIDANAIKEEIDKLDNEE